MHAFANGHWTSTAEAGRTVDLCGLCVGVIVAVTISAARHKHTAQCHGVSASSGNTITEGVHHREYHALAIGNAGGSTQRVDFELNDVPPEVALSLIADASDPPFQYAVQDGAITLSR